MVAPKITVVQMLPELQSGGVERGTLELGAYLARLGHRSIVISGGGRLVSQLENEGSEHITWKVGKKSPAILGYLLPLRRLLQKGKVDILHLRSRVPAWLGFLAWKSLPPGKRPKLITTFHGFYSVNGYSAIMTRGERIIAISKTIANHIQQQYGIASDKIEVIYRGVDDTFDPGKVDSERIKSLQAKWHLASPQKPIILLPGRITRLKGHDIFIKALSVLQGLPWTAVCIGDTGENPRLTDSLLKMVAKLHLQDRIKFVGHCSDMPAAYTLADLVVSATSTHAEAFGRVAVEAMAMAKPVIASAHGGSLETVLPGRTGWLVEPNSAESLTEALREAIPAAGIREQMGLKGRDLVLEHFTVEKMCSHTLKIYKKLIAAP